MIVKGRCTYYDNHSVGNSYLEFNSFAKENIDTTVISGYTYANRSLLNFCNSSTNKLVFDFSREIVPKVYTDLLFYVRDLSRVFVYGNGVEDLQAVNKLSRKGCNFTIEPFFVTHNEKYTPVFWGKSGIVQKPFLLFVGKHKRERLELLKLLKKDNLLDLGHVSFIPIDPNFDPSREGYGDLVPNYFLDSKELTYSLSHETEYMSDYYLKSDFVVVCESDVHNNKGLFITEKSVKAIQLNKKMIILGGKGFLSELERVYLEYMNKDITPLTRWCNTEYDEVEDLQERIELIAKEIKRQTYLFKS